MLGTSRSLLLLGTGLLVACGGVPPWVRPHSPNPPDYQPRLRLEAKHVLDRFEEPRHVLTLSAYVGQDQYCEGLGEYRSASLDGHPLDITSGQLVTKDTLTLFQAYQCREPHVTGTLEWNRIQHGVLEIHGEGTHILAEHPLLVPRPLVDETAPSGARRGQTLRIRWLAPGWVPRQLTAQFRKSHGGTVYPEVRLEGTELLLIFPPEGSTGQGVLSVEGRFEEAFTRCEGIPECAAEISFVDKRAFILSP